jgi:mevalonate kinase
VGVAEAPAKAIITGEHFVVHGSTALAAAIDRRVRVEVRQARSPGISILSDRVSASQPASLLPVKKVVSTVCSTHSIEPAHELNITSTIPRGSGLGSSASTMVAAAAAVAKLHSIKLGLPDLVRFAMQGERLVHGNPSGIDVNACAYGGVILFQVGSPPKRVAMKSPQELLIVYSGVQRSTRRMINKVSYSREKYPRLFGSVADSVSDLSASAAEDLVRGDMLALGKLLTLNHELLTSVGASNQRLDGLVETLLSLGCLGAKLTGAGGGGSVVAIAPEGKGKSIMSQLSERGFEGFETVLPLRGVESWLE